METGTIQFTRNAGKTDSFSYFLTFPKVDLTMGLNNTKPPNRSGASEYHCGIVTNYYD